MSHDDCTCEMCILDREVKALIADKDFDALVKFTKHVMEMWLQAAEDASYYDCIFDGSWPSAKEILTRRLHALEAGVPVHAAKE